MSTNYTIQFQHQIIGITHHMDYAREVNRDGIYIYKKFPRWCTDILIQQKKEPAEVEQLRKFYLEKPEDFQAQGIHRGIILSTMGQEWKKIMLEHDWRVVKALRSVNPDKPDREAILAKHKQEIDEAFRMFHNGKQLHDMQYVQEFCVAYGLTHTVSKKMLQRIIELKMECSSNLLKYLTQAFPYTKFENMVLVDFGNTVPAPPIPEKKKEGPPEQKQNQETEIAVIELENALNQNAENAPAFNIGTTAYTIAENFANHDEPAPDHERIEPL